MSEFPFTAQSATAMGQSPSLLQGSRNYSLSDDLAKLCLPTAFKDEYRKLAWVNSICLLFLVIGLIGLNPPKVVQRPLSEVVDVVPVVFTPPEDQPKPEPQVQPDEPEPQETPLDTPQVVTIVAADSSAVAFAVPVEGPVAVAPARYASPPPPRLTAPRTTTFDPNAEPGGTFPKAPYPREDQLAHHVGKGMLYVIVDPTGLLSSVTVKDSCGYPSLDRHTVQWVTKSWRFLPGQTRYYLVPFEFRMQ